MSFNTIAANTLTTLEKLPKLRELDLSGNNLTTLPVSLNFLHSVETLQLASNGFSSDSMLVDAKLLY